jgi:Domain of unknown function (DUF5615)
VRLLFDQNLSRRLVRLLADVYPDSKHVAEVHLDAADDRAVWEFAKERGLTIVSKDADFRQLSFLLVTRLKRSGCELATRRRAWHPTSTDRVRRSSLASSTMPRVLCSYCPRSTDRFPTSCSHISARVRRAFLGSLDSTRRNGTASSAPATSSTSTETRIGSSRRPTRLYPRYLMHHF